MLKSFLVVVNNLMTKILVWRSAVIDEITNITDQRVMLFARGGSLERLHKAFTYSLRTREAATWCWCTCTAHLNRTRRQPFGKLWT